MKRKTVAVLVGIAVLITAAAALVAEKITWSEVSPDGRYELTGWVIDAGGWGYQGRFYIRENKLFSKRYELGVGICGSEWLSDTEFRIDYSYPLDGNPRNFLRDNYTRVYSVDEFFQ